MTGCIFKLSDGRCDKPGKYMAFCIGEACEHQTPSNYDKLISMTPEELAEWLADLEIRAYKRCGYNGTKKRFKQQYMDWLKSPVEVDE